MWPAPGGEGGIAPRGRAGSARPAAEGPRLRSGALPPGRGTQLEQGHEPAVGTKGRRSCVLVGRVGGAAVPPLSATSTCPAGRGGVQRGEAHSAAESSATAGRMTTVSVGRWAMRWGWAPGDYELKWHCGRADKLGLCSMFAACGCFARWPRTARSPPPPRRSPTRSPRSPSRSPRSSAKRARRSSSAPRAASADRRRRALVEHADVDPRPPRRRRGRARGDRRPARRAPAPRRLPERGRHADAPGGRALPRAPPGVELTLRPAEPERACAPARRRGRHRARLDVSAGRCADDGWSRLHLLDDPMYVVLPRDHPLAAQARAEARRPRRRALDHRHDGPCPDASIFLRACQAAGFEPQHRLQLRRLHRHPGVRGGRRRRLVHPRPRAHLRPRRRRRALAGRRARPCARSSPRR